MVDSPVHPRKGALVNVDLQNVFVEGTPVSPPDGLDVVARLNKLAAACRRAGVLVIHTAHVTRPDGSNVGVMGELSSSATARPPSTSTASRGTCWYGRPARCWAWPSLKC